MSREDRYVVAYRMPRPGKVVTFPLWRSGMRHTATLTSIYVPRVWRQWIGIEILKKSATLLAIVLATALFLIRPAPLSRGLFPATIG